jgi:hypothetical protein
MEEEIEWFGGIVAPDLTGKGNMQCIWIDHHPAVIHSRSFAPAGKWKNKEKERVRLNFQLRLHSSDAYGSRCP